MTLLAPQIESAKSAMPFRISGQVQGVSGLTIEATDLPLPLGSVCRIHSFGGASSVAEVIGFMQGRTLLMPLSGTAGVARGDRIENITSSPRMWCSEELIGRVLDGHGRPCDGKGPLRLSHSRRIDGRGVAPMMRKNIDKPIDRKSVV